ncbi:MAG: carboxypeptidase-like regulatory domain-containing protein, partial [Duncaniella sp.]|nr:carboxypeptidase-like regulatory domain-containing protein [Duncaniella sp.]
MKPTVILIMLLLVFPAFQAAGQTVVDASTLRPLPGASVFDSRGRLMGVADGKGYIPHIAVDRLPATVRCLGYKEGNLTREATDTVFMKAVSTVLPEVIVESPRLKVLHVLGYVREYSTLSTMTDTVFLFREKMVDFMLTPGMSMSMKFKGWTKPRVLKSESYYRFTDHLGLDSVSNKCGHHFSWSDWVSIVPSPRMPAAIRNVETGCDTLRGKYSTAELWLRDNSRVTVDVNVLADASCRRWVREFSGFFSDNLDFQKFKLKADYRNVTGDEISVRDLAAYSFTIESEGRGRDM